MWKEERADYEGQQKTITMSVQSICTVAGLQLVCVHVCVCVCVCVCWGEGSLEELLQTLSRT